MSITIELEPETEKWLNAQAEREGRKPEQIAERLLRYTQSGNGAKGTNGHAAEDEKSDSSYYEVLRAKMMNQTIEEKKAMHEAALRHIILGRPLPPGKTLEDMIAGKWPGNETDEQINTALEDLS